MRRWRAEKRPELHPAAKTFQALRILVNDERNTLREFLRAVPYCLKPGGRVAVISFHSGEDRCVKEAFAQGLAAGLYGPCADRPMRPAPTEYRANPRAASAMLRWARAGDRSP